MYNETLALKLFMMNAVSQCVWVDNFHPECKKSSLGLMLYLKHSFSILNHHFISDYCAAKMQGAHSDGSSWT